MIESIPPAIDSPPLARYLVRYGSVPEVARFASPLNFERGDMVVLQTHRGLQLGSVLEKQRAASDEETTDTIVRSAEAEDLAVDRKWKQECDDAFNAWCARILQWNLNLELIDLEWTLDHEKLILYVLCERGPDSTKLALQAAAAGLGIVEVQPVTAAGLVAAEPQKSCGSGGGGCGCSH